MKTWLTQGLIALCIGLCAGLVMYAAKAEPGKDWPRSAWLQAGQDQASIKPRTIALSDRAHVFKLSESLIVVIIRQDEHGNVIAIDWNKDNSAVERYMTGPGALAAEKALWYAEQKIRKLKSECK